MAAGSMVRVVIYEELGHRAPFHLAASLCAVWSVVVVVYFLARHHGLLSQSFQEAEVMLLARRWRRKAP